MKINNKNKDFFPYLLKAYDICMVGHVIYTSIQSLVNLELLSNMIFEKNHNNEVYVKLKFIKFYFQIIERGSEPLNLIHLVIIYLKFVHSRGGKLLNYFHRLLCWVFKNT